MLLIRELQKSRSEVTDQSDEKENATGHTSVCLLGLEESHPDVVSVRGDPSSHKSKAFDSNHRNARS